MTRPTGYFIGVAVTDPAPGTDLERLPQTPEDLDTLARAFKAAGYEIVDTRRWSPPGEQLSAKDCAARLAHWLGNVKPDEHDRVVFYFFGHAVRSEGFAKHYLCFRGCRPEAPADGGMPVTELAALVLGRASPPGKVWFILDCCYAGQGGAELDLIFAGYSPPPATKDAMLCCVTSSCGIVAQYADGEFSRALGAVLPKISSMPELQSALKAELGARARQEPESRTLFGTGDFFAPSLASPARAMPEPEERAAPRRTKRSRTVLAVAAAVALTAGLVALLRPLEGDASGEPPPPIEGMVSIPRADVRLGESEVEARRLFAECRASAGDACGGEGFESSVFAREVHAPGAAPVSVGSFYLDKTEVSLRAFVRWLDDGKANLRVEREGSKARIVDESGRPIAAVRTAADGAKANPAIALREDNGGFTVDERRADTPVTLVSWHGAQRFCEAHGKRLPTEGEWELAARGVARRRFPWGETAPARCSDVAFAEGPGGACEREARGVRPVGTSRGDVTPDGLLDLGGNVAEWTSSAFAGDEAGAPCAKDSGLCRIFRGGSFADPGPLLRSAMRWRHREDTFWLNIGFRCARDGEVES